ncbi:MAG TPA: hypothetical protein VJZ76_00690 [Thermoanaerobaculia bacterium]|nr:hypothetical protein [Thermoanaerobaculia bacterium]
MAGRQTTHCVEYEDFKNHWQGSSLGPLLPLLLNGLTQGLLFSVLVGGIFALVGALAGPQGALVGLAIGSYVGFSAGFVKGFCDQWLNWRLICVKRDQCAAGRVAWIETVESKFYENVFEWLFDNDKAFNLRLVPYNGKRFINGSWQLEFPRDSEPETRGIDLISMDPFPTVDLLRKPKQSNGADWDLDYNGYEGTSEDPPPNHPGGRWTLHCELEGNGMQTVCSIAPVLAILAPVSIALGPVAGAILGAALGYQTAHKSCKKHCHIPIVCGIVCFLVGVAAAIVAGAAFAILGLFPGLGAIAIAALISLFARDNGEFSDAAVDDESGNIEEGDCVFVFGDHVWDAGHDDGWMEIHPVKHLQKICSHDVFLDDKASVYQSDCCPSAHVNSELFQSDQFHADVKAFMDKWCELLKQGKKGEVIAAQDLPENWWCIHPLVDGCKPKETGDIIK